MASCVPEMFFQCQTLGFSGIFGTVRAALSSQGASCCISVPTLPYLCASFTGRAKAGAFAVGQMAEPKLLHAKIVQAAQQTAGRKDAVPVQRGRLEQAPVPGCLPAQAGGCRASLGARSPLSRWAGELLGRVFGMGGGETGHPGQVLLSLGESRVAGSAQGSVPFSSAWREGTAAGHLRELCCLKCQNGKEICK